MVNRAGYDAVTRGTGLTHVLDRGLLTVTGDDRASYLQGLLSNDVLAIGPGEGCYATHLTQQGRMICDMSVLRFDDRFLLDVPGGVKDAVFAKLEQFVFAEDVFVQDDSGRLGAIDVLGPHADPMVAKIASASVDDLAALAEYSHRDVNASGHRATVSRSLEFGVPGFRVYTEAGSTEAIARAFEGMGAVGVEPDVLNVLRIEAGRPAFGIDMDQTTIPLEAGIEDRAISMTKGCYVGQEVIVRVLHRGQGRVARRLVGLRLSDVGVALPAADDRLEARGEEVGRLTSVARSPRFGVIALGYVRRDLAHPGGSMTVRHGGALLDATVVALPFSAASA